MPESWVASFVAAEAVPAEQRVPPACMVRCGRGFNLDRVRCRKVGWLRSSPLQPFLQTNG